VALALRVAFPLLILSVSKDLRVFHSEDTIEYIEPARSLIQSGRFAAKGLPEIERTPAYPILFIPGIMLGGIEFVTISLQILLSCFSVYLVYKIAVLLFDTHEIGLLCAALYAVEPLSIMYASQLYSETLYATVLLIFLYFLCKYLKNDALSDIIFAAVALAATAYVRPISYFLPPLITFALFIWALLRRQQNRKLILHATIFFMISMGLIVLWQVRNRVDTGYSGFSAISDQNLYFYVGAGILAEKNGIKYIDQQKKMGYGDPETYFSQHPEQRTWSQDKIYRYKNREGIRLVVENPLIFLKLGAENAMTTLRETGTADLLDLIKVDQESPVRARLKLIMKLPLFIGLCFYWLLAVIGIFSGRWQNGAQLMLLITVAAYLVLMASVGGVGYSRFRHPVMPIVCVMAGCGLFTIMKWLKYRANPGN